ncbi:hypothetical protein LXA43DRAFT_1007254 [Ganoderma leucocontextum]|nr:hypothetical protein LXA43DRAFT_1007254 [Ganoderma leucocontextum]
MEAGACHPHHRCFLYTGGVEHAYVGQGLETSGACSCPEKHPAGSTLPQRYHLLATSDPELRGPGGTIARAQEQARALGYRFPEDEAKPATPTTPNSVAEERFKGGVKNVKSLPKPHMVTRKKSLQTILAIHDKAGDEDSSGDEDGEGEGDG